MCVIAHSVSSLTYVMFVQGKIKYLRVCSYNNTNKTWSLFQLIYYGQYGNWSLFQLIYYGQYRNYETIK